MMRAGIRSLCKEESGVSVVIGAMLMLLIVAAMWGTIQSYHVPNWNKDVEYEHLNMVHDDMITFKSDVEDVALSRAPKSSEFRMGVRYPNRMFLANPGTGVAGSLTSESVNVTVQYTLSGGGSPVTQTYSSSRIAYEVHGTIDNPKLVYEHGLVIRDYGNASATTDEQPLIAGDEIYIPVLTGNLTSLSSMETQSVNIKPLSQSNTVTGINWTQITLYTNYPGVWAQLLAGTGTANTTVSVNQTQSKIVITSTAVRQITFPTGDVTAEALYAGMIKLSTTPVPGFIIGGGTGLTTLSRSLTNYVPMFNAGVSSVESGSQQFMPVAGTVSRFYIILNISPGSGKSFTFIVRKNGAATPVTCTISGTATTGSDLTNSVSFAAGDYISIMVTPASNPTATAMCWTAKFSPSQ